MISKLLGFVIVLFISITTPLSAQIVGTKTNSEGLNGFVDKKGNYIVPPIYYRAYWDNEDQIGTAYITIDDYQSGNGLIFNSNGIQIYPTGYVSAYLHENTGLLYLKEAYIEDLKQDSTQNEGITLKKGQYINYISGTPYLVSYLNGVGDTNGNIIIPCKYDEIYYSTDDNGFIVIRETRIGKLYGLIDKNGNIIIPCEFKKIRIVADDIYLVQNRDDKYGYYSNGIEIIPCIYDNASNFVDDVATVTKNGEVSLIANPLKDSDFKIEIAKKALQQNKTKIQSRYPVANSEVDNNIPQLSLQYENKFAIIIANENYDISPVPYALNDGRKFKQYCVEALGIPEKNVYMYEDATYGNIISAIERIKSLSEVFDGDLDLIVYYAGHGTPDVENKSAYLLPIDGSVSDIKHTGYSLKSLYGELSRLKTNKITFFIDACFSGAKRDDEMLISGRGVAIKVNNEIPQNNMIVFSASTGNETAHQLTEKKHGLFTYYLLKAIQDSMGDITLGDLSDYVIKNVKRQSVVINSKKQTPTVIPSEEISGNWRSIKL